MSNLDDQETRFLNSEVGEDNPLARLRALSRTGDAGYIGLETFPNPGCHSISFAGDELVAHCPVTGQPDFYDFSIIIVGSEKSIESKSLKMWLRQFADPGGPGLFCESLTVYIRDQVAEALEVEEDNVQVTLTQKSRGGISIRAVA